MEFAFLKVGIVATVDSSESIIKIWELRAGPTLCRIFPVIPCQSVGTPFGFKGHLAREAAVWVGVDSTDLVVLRHDGSRPRRMDLSAHKPLAVTHVSRDGTYAEVMTESRTIFMDTENLKILNNPREVINEPPPKKIAAVACKGRKLNEHFCEWSHKESTKIYLSFRDKKCIVCSGTRAAVANEKAIVTDEDSGEARLLDAKTGSIENLGFSGNIDIHDH